MVLRYHYCTLSHIFPSSCLLHLFLAIMCSSLALLVLILHILPCKLFWCPLSLSLYSKLLSIDKLMMIHVLPNVFKITASYQCFIESKRVCARKTTSNVNSFNRRTWEGSRRGLWGLYYYVCVCVLLYEFMW